ncbi:MAG: carbohydrate kinase family protein [Promethearchaeota archaeon]
MPAKRFDLVIVGHLTIDLMKSGDKEHTEMGGPPAYAMVGPALGLKNVGIVSRIGRDFPPAYYDRLVCSGLNLEGLRQNKHTTHFTNTYNELGDRTQRVDAVSDPLTSEDFPNTYWNTLWMHISPVIGEVDSSIIPKAKSRGIQVSVDVQGFIRTRKNKDTEIISCEWEKFSELAAYIDALKVDSQELRQLTHQSDTRTAAQSVHKMGVPLILITRGYKGAHLSYGDNYYDIPAIEPQHIVDHTGSGDVFSISFLVELQRTQRPLWSAFFASAAASYNLETPGPTNFPSYEQVITRLRGFLALQENRQHTEKLLNEPGSTECPL